MTPEPTPRLCACGCGLTPKGTKSLYLAGHDARHLHRAGFVYAMRPVAGGPVKLGHAVNLKKRLAQTQRWRGELEVIWSKPVSNVISAECCCIPTSPASGRTPPRSGSICR
jgi:hypothetical protein